MQQGVQRSNSVRRADAFLYPVIALELNYTLAVAIAIRVRFSSGNRKCAAHQYHLSWRFVRTIRAWNFRRAWLALSHSGKAVGISSNTLDPCCRCLRVTNSTPPALTFKIVLNSKNSLPFSSGPLTKTGMASGSRGQRRRSPSGGMPSPDCQHSSIVLGTGFTFAVVSLAPHDGVQLGSPSIEGSATGNAQLLRILHPGFSCSSWGEWIERTVRLFRL